MVSVRARVIVRIRPKSSVRVRVMFKTSFIVSVRPRSSVNNEV